MINDHIVAMQCLSTLYNGLLINDIVHHTAHSLKVELPLNTFTS